jgi:hypothetical protein
VYPNSKPRSGCIQVAPSRPTLGALRNCCCCEILSGLLAILGLRLPPPGSGSGPQARRDLGMSLGVPTGRSLNRDAKVRGHFGHPQGVQVKALSLRFYIRSFSEPLSIFETEKIAQARRAEVSPPLKRFPGRPEHPGSIKLGANRASDKPSRI